ncbi:MAG: MMPL family transporter, partial [Planctomycetota bacterium]|nr:MMPL family transporter [Planctomycetota bacterium]
PFTGLGCIMGLLGWFGIPLNIVNNVVTPLVLVIGFAEAIHVMFVTGGFIAGGDRPANAVLKMLGQLLVPCMLAALTTAIGFGSLFFSEDQALREFSIVASGSSLLMFLYVLVVSSCLLASPVGRYCVGTGQEKQGTFEPTFPLSNADEANGFSSFSLSAVVCILSILSLVLFVCLSVKNNTDYRFTENLPESNPAVNTLWEIDEALGGSSQNLLVVEFLRKPNPQQLIGSLRDIQNELEKNPLIAKTVSFLNLLDSMPDQQGDAISKFRELKYLPADAWKSFLKINPTVASFVVKLPDLGSDRLKPCIQEIVQQAERLERRNPNLSMHFVGLNVLAVSRSQKMISDLITSLLGASVIIFALIMLVYRSLIFGVAAIVVNAFPILGVAALMEWMGQPIQYNGIMLLCTCLGLAVDDTVHFLSKLKMHLSQGLEFKAAITRTVQKLWPVLLTTSVILGVGFGLAATSDIPTFQTFGGYACVALGLALLGDLLILPHILIFLHRIFVKP